MVGYNVQSAVDTETHIIVTHEVTNQGFDRDQLSPMSIAAKDALGRDTLHAIADKGYFSGPEILACHEAGITTTVPRPATSGNAAKGMYVKADFTYDAGRDVYVCPAGEDLTYRYTTEERGVQLRRYWALLHKWSDGEGSRIPGQTYPTTSVMGVPRAVKPFRTATRTWNSAT